ncbi:DUF3817 domain-containing protein [Catenulispora rubra]|uniref:DUF3817 domain-containing protein n=1 Tax=Catenulispora rubra TaxID=280293 RepID=UPI001E412E59|nr:DUF3817 domain-containing protein [Catenulispora rubra]
MVTARFFRIAAFVELVTLVVLLGNLATFHVKPVTSLIGPTHGCAYLIIVLATWRNDRAAFAGKLTALLPGIGGFLVLRLLSQHEAADVKTL